MMMTFRELYSGDLHRYSGLKGVGNIKRLLYYYRRASTAKNHLLLKYYRFRFWLLRNRRGIDLSYRTQIGRGLYLGHAYAITVGPNVRIVENCNLHKGVTLGRTNRGKHAGSPVLGDRVWIGINATVVGGITVGDDVLIAPGAYVNFDVPSHSVVIGNPGVIHSRDDATEGYIYSPVE